MNALLMSLLLAAPVIQAQPIEKASRDSLPSSFEVGMFMGDKWTINLMLAVHQPKQVIVTLRDAKGEIVYRDYLKKAPGNYRIKVKFDEPDAGVYQFEVSDGKQTVIRRVEVVEMPAIESQRYITYGPQINL